MARMTLSQIAQHGGTIDWDKVNATTEADIDRQAREDGTDDTSHLSAPYPTPATVRKALHMTQKQIADLTGIPVATWRNWEQGRVGLDPAVQALLRILGREPDAARRALDVAAE
ncbi:hypothetical protein KSAC_09220 [Komagataeibacter saccharivorans]|uniref:helix-turn-helix domain-containing protein n=1 Tax=Komagataeibacter saccharivorans TaxID=265959 RepID=UPI0010434D56|nr:helix-turn-helix domain-containing protein [Komagataeibacter saccharivorans]QBL93163.1 hypothetical protein KSAC_09220 [Komagataeibacter saccharivorans]